MNEKVNTQNIATWYIVGGSIVGYKEQQRNS